MPSNRKTIANLAGIGKLKQSKKYPDRLFLEIAFAKTNGKSSGHYSIRVIPTRSIEMVIKEWLAPAYEAAMNSQPDPWSLHYLQEEPLRQALDLCYKELARRAEKI